MARSKREPPGVAPDTPVDPGLNDPDPGLLDGIRVVELSQLIAAPLCGLQLADLGAAVLKVEPPGGDPMRSFPPFAVDGESATFHALNRDKRGVVLDLRADAGRERLGALVGDADVVVENLGDGAAAALGVSAAAARKRHPRLVWCSITGLGHGAGGRAMDPLLQASMGMLALTGESPERPPVRIPVPLVDITTALAATQAILGALWQRERTGEGALLDLALLDSAAALTGLAALQRLSGIPPRRMGSQGPLAVPSAAFRAGDGGYVQITATTERQWRALCAALERPEWVQDARFADAAVRLRHRDGLNALIDAELARAGAAEWARRITAAGGLAARVREIEEAWEDPVLAERGLVTDLGGVPMPLLSLVPPREPGRQVRRFSPASSP